VLKTQICVTRPQCVKQLNQWNKLLFIIPHRIMLHSPKIRLLYLSLNVLWSLTTTLLKYLSDASRSSKQHYVAWSFPGLSHFPHDKRSVKVKMSKQRWWNDSKSRKPNYSEKILYHWANLPTTNFTRTGPGFRGEWPTTNQPPETWHGLKRW